MNFSSLDASETSFRIGEVGKQLVEAAESNYQVKKAAFEALTASPASTMKLFADLFKGPPAPVFQIKPIGGDGDPAFAQIPKRQNQMEGDYTNVTKADTAIKTMDFKCQINRTSVTVSSWNESWARYAQRYSSDKVTFKNASRAMKLSKFARECRPTFRKQSRENSA